MTYTSDYIVYEELRCTLNSKFKIFQPPSDHSLFFVSWNQLELLAVLLWEQHYFYVRATLSWQELEFHCMLCVPTSLMIVFYSGAL